MLVGFAGGSIFDKWQERQLWPIAVELVVVHIEGPHCVEKQLSHHTSVEPLIGINT